MLRFTPTRLISDAFLVLSTFKDAPNLIPNEVSFLLRARTKFSERRGSGSERFFASKRQNKNEVIHRSTSIITLTLRDQLGCSERKGSHKEMVK